MFFTYVHVFHVCLNYTSIENNSNAIGLQGEMKMDNKQPFDLHGFFQRLYGTDNEELIARSIEASRIVRKRKGEIIFKPGVTQSSTTIVLDGVIKTYILSPDGVENTLAYIFQPGTCVAMHEDMINVPKMWCKTVTPCTLIEMSPGPYELAEEFPELWKKLVLAWRPFYYGMMDKLRAGYTLTAKERYLWFVDKYAPIVDLVPLVEIARFLGIKPQSLSRIRAELAEEGSDQHC